MPPNGTPIKADADTPAVSHGVLMNRHVLLERFNTVVALFSIFYCLVSWFIDFLPGMYIMAVNALLLLANGVYLRGPGRALMGAHTFLFVNCFVAVFGSSFFSGGLYSPVLPWFALVPLAAILLLGVESNIWWWLVSPLGCVAGFAAFAFFGVHTPTQFDIRFSVFFALTCVLGHIVLLFIYGNMFESAKNLALGEAALRNQELQQAIQRLNQTREQLVQQEKLASLGALVAGVAHELNTPIGNALTTSSSMGHAARLLHDSVERGELRKSALLEFLKNTEAMNELVVRSCERAATLITSFKQVAVDQTSEQRREFEVLPLVEDNVNALRPSFKHAPVNIVLEVPAGIRCNSYPGPLGQVLVNLVQNAVIHGFAGGRGGTIKITAYAEQSWVHMEVEDDGLGMSDEVKSHIFDPFFTTRLGQGGSGLGLSVSQNIIRRVLGGTIDVHSELGRGTRFSLRFPGVAELQAVEAA